ncbi:MAG TPA: DUF5946 family protein [Thermoanaerobaculia bacterium]|nr:DUF5946 family protein [Thermoanaerobaculia bacterium]
MSDYDELAYYTLAHGDPAFIHQHIVDAWAAQTASESAKPIAIAFALAGLYLHCERKFTGRQVQLAHMKMAQRKREWPKFDLPANRGSMTAADVLKTEPGPERDQAIDRWAAAVWDAFRANRETIIAMLRQYDLA